MLAKVAKQLPPSSIYSYNPVARSLQKVGKIPSSLQKVTPTLSHLQNYVEKSTSIQAVNEVPADLQNVAEKPTNIREVFKPPSLHLQNYVKKSTSIQTVNVVPADLQKFTGKPTNIQKVFQPPSRLQNSSSKPCSVRYFTETDCKLTSIAAILSSSGLPHSQKADKAPFSRNASEKKSRIFQSFSSVLSTSGLPLQSQQRRPLTSACYDSCVLDGNYLQTTAQKIEKYSEAFKVEAATAEKILAYSKLQPTPVSIEEFVARGVPGAVSEEDSYANLVHEVTVRLSHMLMEMNNLPQQVKDLKPASDTIKLYTRSFNEILQFRGKDPEEEQVLRDFVDTLKRFKSRHSDTVVEMANAVQMLREETGMSVIDANSGLANCIQYYLDRLYMARISIHMITNQHLMVYGSIASPPGQIGVIDPNTYVTSAIVDAYDDARYMCEQSYMVAPKLVLKTRNTMEEDVGNKNNVVCAHVPAHMYHIFFETMKNAMRATVEFHWDDQDNLPPIKVLVVQSSFDITVRISDQGGGMDRDTVERKIFQYLYTSSPHSNVDIDDDIVPMFGLGYGLPLSRLYAKYFRGDLKVASYEGYGTDVYVYLHSLARNAREHLPVYNTTSSRRMNDLSAKIPGWTSSARFHDNRITENACIRS